MVGVPMTDELYRRLWRQATIEGITQHELGNRVADAFLDELRAARRRHHRLPLLGTPRGARRHCLWMDAHRRRALGEEMLWHGGKLSDAALTALTRYLNRTDDKA